MKLSSHNVWVKPTTAEYFHKVVPGLLLTFGIAMLASNLQKFPSLSFLSPLILAVILGILVRNSMGVPAIYKPGIVFSLKRLLKISIAFLGLNLSFAQVQQIGLEPLAIIVITTTCTFGLTCWLGERLGIKRSLAQLIAAGTSICGASAIVATGSTIESSDEDMAYAVTIISLFGSLSMVFYPLLANVLQFQGEVFGLWCGISIHEVAQVVATAFQGGDVSGEAGTISKLVRVLFLIPTLLFLGSGQQSDSSDSGSTRRKKIPIPWFIVGFIALIAVNSFMLVPEEIRSLVVTNNKFMIVIAMAAMGLEINLGKLKQMGLKPMLLGAFAWIFISSLSYGLLRYVY